MFKLILLFLTLIIFVSCTSYHKQKSLKIDLYPPDQHPLHVPIGYESITYEVQTSDGYLLSLFHFLNAKNQNERSIRPVVLLMHGMMSDSRDFLYAGNDSLVYNLLRNNFEVFLANTRGSFYGMGHTTLDPNKDPEFWNFSFDEIALRDLPAIVDKVLEITGQTRIGYVGHMEGSMIFFMMISELHRRYADKFYNMVALGPMAYMKNFRNKVLGKIIDFHTCDKWIDTNVGKGLFNPSEDLLSDLKIDCLNSSLYKDLICDNDYFLIRDYNSINLNEDVVKKALQYLPNDGSVHQLIHLAQMVKLGSFQSYSKNWTIEPDTRIYDMAQVNVSVTLVYTAADSFSNLTDICNLKETLHNIYQDYYYYQSENNLDLLYGNKIQSVNTLVLRTLKSVFENQRLNAFEFNSFFAYNSLKTTEELHPNAGLHMADLVHKYNYPLETHQVQTEDGYILTVFRIPHGRNEVTSPKQNKKPVIMLMHGLLLSSIDWVNSGPEKGLGFMLADAGYDVWFGNQRGNINSRKHIHLDIKKDQQKFFNFSFHEISCHDIPATIDYILNTTQAEKIYYVGHSQGSTAFFVMASDRPEYNEKIHLMAALAPVVYINHAKSPVVKILALFYEKFITTMECIEQYEFLPYEYIYYLGAKRFCNGTGPVPDLCTELFSLISGYDLEQWDPTLSTVVLTNVPAGSSLGQVQHFLQLYKSKKFQQFDYGPEINQEKYGSQTPPLYDLSKITAPVALYYGQNDWLCSVKDVDRLKKELPKIVKDGKIPYKQFNHLDFLWANDVKLLYNDLLNYLQNYSSQN